MRASAAEPGHANDVYTLIEARNFCGVIVLSSVVGPHVDDAALSGWIQSFGLPVVSIGRALRGADNVLVDNVPGMSALMTHLLDTMGHRQLAFVRGIPGNSDSDERESVFRASLQRRGLPVEEDLLMTGDFASVKTFRRVQQLLARRRDVQILEGDYARERDVFARWAQGFEDRYGKFVKEFQLSFESCLWELYLHASLKELSLPVDFSHHAPDFVIGCSFQRLRTSRERSSPGPQTERCAFERHVSAVVRFLVAPLAPHHGLQLGP